MSNFQYSKWLSTNDLRILDINKINKNKNMKPRTNPIHSKFVDNIVDVFKKFNFNENDFYGKGGFNKIYKNKSFILRITRKILNNNNKLKELNKTRNVENVVESVVENVVEVLEDLKEFNEKDKYINIDYQKLSEKILVKAIKNNLSPHVYYFGNININNFIHRYMIMEAYTMSLDVFFKNHEYLYIQNNYNYYKDYGDLMDSVGFDLIKIFEKLNSINFVYYDVKPENIVVNVNSIGKIDLKLIDWDCEYIDEIEWISNYENKEYIVFLNLLIISYFVNIFYKKKFLKKILRNMYISIKIITLYELLDYLPKYRYILKHYFFGDCSFNKNENQENQENQENEKLKKLILYMINRSL